MNGLSAVCAMFLTCILFMISYSALHNVDITFEFTMFYGIISLMCFIGFLMLSIFNNKNPHLSDPF